MMAKNTRCECSKVLEFKTVAVMACQSRLESVVGEVELDDVYETECQLFSVTCTRAPDRLLISATNPVSEFLRDLRRC